MNNKPILSISFLSSGRKDTLKKCLDSLKPLLDAVDSELIIVDTGCNEEMKALMLEYTDKIVPFTWCNDFAKARNAGLQSAKGEWFLYIDDDEWFLDVEELISFFSTGEYKDYSVGNYYQRNYHNYEGTAFNDAWVTRAIRRDKDICFRSSIHEHFHPIKPGKTKLFKNTVVAHYGYIYATKEAFNEHSRRNVSLLLEALRKERKEIRWWIHLAQEYVGLEEWYRLMDFCEEGINYFEKDNRADVITGRGGLYTAWIHGCAKADFPKEVIKTYERGMKDPRVTDFAKAAMCAEAVGSYYRLGEYEKCTKVCERYFAYYDKLAEDEAAKFIQGSLFVEKAFKPQKRNSVYEAYMKCGLKNGDITPLKACFSKLSFLHEDADGAANVKADKEFVKDIVNAMAAFPYDEAFPEIANILANNERTKGIFWKNISKFVTQNQMQEKETLQIAKIISEIESRHLCYWYLKILHADSVGETADLEYYFRELILCALDLFEIEDAFFEIATKRNIDLEKMIAEIPFKRFCFSVDAFCKKAEPAKIDKRIQAIWAVPVETADSVKMDMRFRYFAVKRWERVVLSQPENVEYEVLGTLLEKFADKCVAFYKGYFKESAFEEDMALLPPMCCAAVKICQIRQAEKHNEFRKAGELLKELTQEYIPFAGVARQYAELSAEHGKQLVEQQQETLSQMEALAAQIKGKVYELLESGQIEAAKTVFVQLKQLIPKDSEMIALGEKLGVD